MDLANRCQSCGMPLGEGFYGLDDNGFFSKEYCRFCFHEGAFVEPELMLEDMLRKSVDQMMFEFHFPAEKAWAMAEEVIPKLKRWREE